MRLTVIFTEVVMVGALLALSKQSRKEQQQQGIEDEESKNIRKVSTASLLFHPGLIIVDHIHFQYNGFLYGVLLWSIWAAREVSWCRW